MSYFMIATWKMAEAGVKIGQHLLSQNATAEQALIAAIKDVEDNPEFTSVGYGGLPNTAGKVQLDAGFMDGKTFEVCGLAGAETIANPIEVAASLARLKFNNFLVGPGADRYAKINNFAQRDGLTDNAQQKWLERKELVEKTNISPYAGHDTVGMVVIDQNQHMVTGTSTSGIFMKEPGRVGDSPMPGSGYYAVEGVGGAAATGMGEDIMKGALSYATVSKMAAGLDAQTAVQQAGEEFVALYKQHNGHEPREISLVALDASGNFGVYTNVDFYYVKASSELGFESYHIWPAENGGYHEELLERIE